MTIDDCSPRRVDFCYSISFPNESAKSARNHSARKADGRREHVGCIGGRVHREEQHGDDEQSQHPHKDSRLILISSENFAVERITPSAGKRLLGWDRGQHRLRIHAGPCCRVGLRRVLGQTGRKTRNYTIANNRWTLNKNTPGKPMDNKNGRLVLLNAKLNLRYDADKQASHDQGQ